MEYSPLSREIFKNMLIGDLVKKTGLSKDTIRFYEKHGLISVGRKERRDNNYKEYSEGMFQRLILIKKLKGFGFTLNEITDLLDMIDVNEATCHNVAHKIEGKVQLLDEKIKELIRIRTLLLNGMKVCEKGCSPSQPKDNCPILVEGKI